MSGEALAEAAAGLVGCPFRLHGRDPATGVDCLGLVLVALVACGRSAAFTGDSSLRMRSVAGLVHNAPALGFAEVAGKWRAGDIILFSPGQQQHHLAIANGSGSIIHAHAGLGRVACAPPPTEWQAIGHWRLTD